MSFGLVFFYNVKRDGRGKEWGKFRNWRRFVSHLYTVRHSVICLPKLLHHKQFDLLRKLSLCNKFIFKQRRRHPQSLSWQYIGKWEVKQSFQLTPLHPQWLQKIEWWIIILSLSFHCWSALSFPLNWFCRSWKAPDALGAELLMCIILNFNPWNIHGWHTAALQHPTSKPKWPTGEGERSGRLIHWAFTI